MNISNQEILDWVAVDDISISGSVTQIESQAAAELVRSERKFTVMDAIASAAATKQGQLEADLAVVKHITQLLERGHDFDDVSHSDRLTLLTGVGDVIGVSVFKSYARLSGFPKTLAARVIYHLRPRDGIEHIKTASDYRHIINVPLLEESYTSGGIDHRTGIGPASHELVSAFLNDWNEANPQTPATAAV